MPRNVLCEEGMGRRKMGPDMGVSADRARKGRAVSWTQSGSGLGREWPATQITSKSVSSNEVASARSGQIFGKMWWQLPGTAGTR